MYDTSLLFFLLLLFGLNHQFICVIANGAFVDSFVDLSVHLFAHLLSDCLSVQLLVRLLVQNIVVSQRRSSATFICFGDTPWHIMNSAINPEVLVCDAESFVIEYALYYIVTLAPCCLI